MSDRPNNHIAQSWPLPLKHSINVNLPGLIVGHAVRNKVRNSVNLNETSTTTSQVIQNQSKISFQIKEALKSARAPVTTKETKTRLPLNMIVSKMARRTPALEKHKENEDPLQNFDATLIRNSKLLTPPWKAKHEYTKTHVKRLQHAYLHNKRMAELFQAKKTNIGTFSRYDPTDASQGRRDRDFEKWLLGSISNIKNEEISSQEENFRQLYGCSPNAYLKSIAPNPPVSPEDPYPSNLSKTCLKNLSSYACKQQQENSCVSKISENFALTDYLKNQPIHTYRQEQENNIFVSRPKQVENFKFDPTPAIQKAKEVFVWNPVIVPMNQWPKFENENENEDFDFLSKSDWTSFDVFNSPGNCTVSSSSSGLSVSEERIQLTYFATRCRPRPESPAYTSNYLEKSNNLSLSPETPFNLNQLFQRPDETPENFSWLFQRNGVDFNECSEE